MRENYSPTAKIVILLPVHGGTGSSFGNFGLNIRSDQGFTTYVGKYQEGIQGYTRLNQISQELAREINSYQSFQICPYLQQMADTVVMGLPWLMQISQGSYIMAQRRPDS